MPVSPSPSQSEDVDLTHVLVFQNLVYPTRLACKYSSKKGEFLWGGGRKMPTLKIRVNSGVQGWSWGFTHRELAPHHDKDPWNGGPSVVHALNKTG